MLKVAGERGQPEDKQDEADMIQAFMDQVALRHVPAAQQAVSAARATLAGGA